MFSSHLMSWVMMVPRKRKELQVVLSAPGYQMVNLPPVEVSVQGGRRLRRRAGPGQMVDYSQSPSLRSLFCPYSLLNRYLLPYSKVWAPHHVINIKATFKTMFIYKPYLQLSFEMFHIQIKSRCDLTHFHLLLATSVGHITNVIAPVLLFPCEMQIRIGPITVQKVV